MIAFIMPADYPLELDRDRMEVVTLAQLPFYFLRLVMAVPVIITNLIESPINRLNLFPLPDGSNPTFSVPDPR